jgi:WD40 repeat protein
MKYLTSIFFFCILSLVVCADASPHDVKRKANKAVIYLREWIEQGRDVQDIVPKMQRVEVLGKAGKITQANALLDEILLEFEQGRICVNSSASGEFINDRDVKILDYNEDAMEPFISRDGQYLFFNSMTRGKRSKDIFYATKVDDYTFQFKGEVKNINTSAVEGVPTMDMNGNFFFLSTYAYKPNSLVSVYQGRFKDGAVIDIRPLSELSLNKSGWLNMDSEISADGQTLYSTHSYFDRGKNIPSKSYFFYARKVGDMFVPQKDSVEIFKKLNHDKIVYGATISTDELEILYTRLLLDKLKFESMRAVRSDKNLPFEKPEVILSIKGFSEAPALTENGNVIYYHKKSKDGKFRIHALHRNRNL